MTTNTTLKLFIIMSRFLLFFSALGVAVFHSKLVLAEYDKFSSWFEEQTKEIMDEGQVLSVNGQIPSYINGELVRVGPSVISTRKKNYTNYLDAFGRISSWSVDGNSNSISIKSTIIKSLLWNHSTLENSKSRHISQEKNYPETKPGAFDLDEMDNTDVNVYRFKDSDSFLTLTDFHLMNEIHVDSLRTLGTVQHNDDDAVPDNVFFSSSHPGEHIDPVTGEVRLVNWLGKKTLTGSTIYVYSMGKDLKRSIIGAVDISYLPYSIHSAAVVDDYVVIIAAPVKLDFMKTGINLCISCSINNDLSKEPTQIFFFSLYPTPPLKDGDLPQPVSVIEVPPPDAFFTFHYINAWKSQTSQQVYKQ